MSLSRLEPRPWSPLRRKRPPSGRMQLQGKPAAGKERAPRRPSFQAFAFRGQRGWGGVVTLPLSPGPERSCGPATGGREPRAHEVGRFRAAV